MNSRLVLAAGILILVASAAGCSTPVQPNGSCASNGAAATVIMTSNGYSPNAVGIGPDQVVCWKNSTNVAHTVTADDGTFDAPLDVNGNYSHNFVLPGLFHYHCSLHAGEVGTVSIQ